MKKILVVASGDIYERRGMFNAVVSRIHHLQEICDCQIDALLLSTYEPWLVRKLRHTSRKKRIREFLIDDVRFEIHWGRFFLLDYILQRFHMSPFFSLISDNRLIKKLYGYDLVIAHSTRSGFIACKAKEKYGIPYMVTWHGSDIHTLPLLSNVVRKKTIFIMENANYNFFVSNALLKLSDNLTTKAPKEVLYNGCNKNFYEYPIEKKCELKEKFGVKNKKVVVFAGNFLKIKNILSVPKIFKCIYEDYKNVEFWMIGDGKYRYQIEETSMGLPIKFWGNQNPENMPDFINCADVQILPSLNEGLPLTMVEALRCGCNAVGSLVGGIPEVIGEENCVSLKEGDFEKKIANKVVSFLENADVKKQILDVKFDWNYTAMKEHKYIKEIINL